MRTFRTIARHTITTLVLMTISAVITLATVLGIGLVTGTAQVYDAGDAGIVYGDLGGFDWRSPTGPGFYICHDHCGI